MRDGGIIRALRAPPLWVFDALLPLTAIQQIVPAMNTPTSFSRRPAHVGLILGLVALASVTGCKRMRGRGGRGGGGGGVAMAAPTNDSQRALYSLGALQAQGLREFNLTPAELAFVHRGMQDQLTGARLVVNPREYIPRLREMSEERARAASAETRRRGREFAERAAREPGAQVLPSGLVYRDIAEGDGPSPTAQDTVTVHYRGTLPDGTEFDSSRGRGEPATFPLGGVIPCWTEGVQRMKVHGRARLVCPPDIAYGDRGQRQIPAGSTLDFEVELISIAPRPQAADGDGGAPPNVSPSAPNSTTTTTTGAADPHAGHGH